MTMVEITLPDPLAPEAQRAGLLSPNRPERWLREQLKAQRVDDLWAAMDRMDGAEAAAVRSPEEVVREIATRLAKRGMQRT